MELSFLDPTFINRIKRSPQEKDLLRTALGKTKKLKILDATAGLCRDALRMAHWGHTVCACERDPSLAQLLLQCFEEAKSDPFYSKWIQRLLVVSTSTEEFLLTHPDAAFDVVVIDAMFPDEKRKGLPKKNIQELKALLKNDKDNAEEIFSFCWKYTWALPPKKILVKRPLKAPPFKGIKASHEYKGRSHRWDLYLPISR